MKQIVKKLVTFLLVALLLSALNMGTWSVLADEVEKGPFTYEVKDGAVTIITADTDLKGKVEIPATIEDCPVTAIGKMAFYGCRGVTAVTIPASVTEIGKDALGNCMHLTRIEVDNDNTFFCDVDGVLYNKEKTTLIRFPNMYGLASYTIPDGVTTIISGAFFGCSDLRTVEFADSVTTIGTNAFHFTSVEEIVLPPHLTVVEYGLFSGSALLEKVVLPDGVTSIGTSAFGGCKKLKDVNIPDSVTKIGNDAFSGCQSLVDITIPESVVSIGERCFADCSSLVEISIPNSVTTLGARAFFFCPELKTVDLGDSITVIEEETFAACRKLTTISMPDTVTTIGEQAFHYCESLTQVTIPAKVSRIEMGAFSGCKTLAEIVLPECVLAINDDAFRNCAKLATVTVPSSVKTVEQGAFTGCEILKNVYYNGSSKDKSKIDIAKGNGEFSSAQWHYAVEDKVQVAVKKDTEEEFVMPPWMKTALYVGVLVVAVIVLILMFRNTSED